MSDRGDEFADGDVAALADIRERLVAAENSGDPSPFEQLLADDAVMMPPYCEPLEGKTACLDFIRSVMADVQKDFASHEMTVESSELIIRHDIAFDRGIFVHRLRPKANGAAPGSPEFVETGSYLWIHMRAADGTWRVSRLTGTITPTSEFESESTQ